MPLISYNNLQVRYDYLPSQQQTAGNLVLLHSLGLSMEEFDRILPYFQPTFNVLRFDMLGHGQSELPPTPITADSLAEQLAYMTNRFFKEKFYILAGPGMGFVASRFCPTKIS